MSRCLLVLTLAWTLCESYDTIFDGAGWSLVHDRDGTLATGTAEERRIRVFDRFQRIDEILTRIEQLPLSLTLLSDILYTTIQDSRPSFLLYHLKASLSEVENIYWSMRALGENPKFEYVKDQSGRIHRYAMQIFHFMAASGTTKMDEEIVRRMKESPSQTLYHLYSLIALAETKCYVLMQLSYALLEIETGRTYRQEARLLNEDFLRNSSLVLKEVKRAMEKRSTHFWRYDPDKNEKDDFNYLELTGLGQGFIINEKVFVGDRQCTGKCGKYTEVQLTNRVSTYDSFRRNKQCSGRLYDCNTLNARELLVCQSEAGSSRRYDYVRYVDTGALFGEESGFCRKNTTIEAPKWCPYCICYCDQMAQSTRAFSLLQVVSDIKENMAVTGLRFVKRNKVIYVQVQQGKLLPYGRIDANTLEWVPVNYDQHDIHTKTNNEIFVMDWHNKILDLHSLPEDADNGYVPEEAVLTGVRFNTLKSEEIHGKDTRLFLEIQLTRINFEEGKLYPERASVWIDGLNQAERKEIDLRFLDVPTRAGKNSVQKGKNQYVRFTPTSSVKDVAQTIVPFLDAQDVVSATPMALRGAGLYYKSAPRYGGFVGLELVTYDANKHF